jgi:hypothetical protein
VACSRRRHSEPNRTAARPRSRPAATHIEPGTAAATSAEPVCGSGHGRSDTAGGHPQQTAPGQRTPWTPMTPGSSLPQPIGHPPARPTATTAVDTGDPAVVGWRASNQPPVSARHTSQRKHASALEASPPLVGPSRGTVLATRGRSGSQPLIGCSGGRDHAPEDVLEPVATVGCPERLDHRSNRLPRRLLAHALDSEPGGTCGQPPPNQGLAIGVHPWAVDSNPCSGSSPARRARSSMTPGS